MFKPYFTYKGNRYGWHNKIKSRKKTQTFMDWRLWRGTGTALVLICINNIFYNLYNIYRTPLLLIAIIVFCVAWVSYSVYFLARGSKVKCKFCSTNKEEAKRFGAEMSAKHNLPLDSHEIVLEDGWYMVYYNSKTGKEERMQYG